MFDRASKRPGRCWTDVRDAAAAGGKPVAIEQNDEWLVGRRYLSAQSMEPLLEERLHQDEEEVLELEAA